MSEDKDEQEKKKKSRLTFDEIIYNQRLFFVMIVFAIAVVSVNPWILYQTQQEDRASEREQTREVLDNQERNFNRTNSAIQNQDELINKLDILLNLIIEGQRNENIRGNVSEARFNITLGEIREGVITINKTVVEEAAQDANLTREQIEGVVRVITDVGEIIPRMNHTISAQLVPLVATIELQHKAEQDHFNQTETILDQIKNSSEIIQEQARLINQTGQ